MSVNPKLARAQRLLDLAGGPGPQSAPYSTYGPLTADERAAMAAAKVKFDAQQAEQAKLKVAKKASQKQARAARLQAEWEHDSSLPVDQSVDCGHVRKAGRPRRGCTCQACNHQREVLANAAQERRDREALAEVERWLAEPTRPAPTTLRRVLGKRVNQWGNIDWLEMFWSDRGVAPDRCAYCDGPREVIEHIIPVASGGGSEFNNLLPACQPCNSSKAAKDPWEWLAATHPDRLAQVQAYKYAVMPPTTQA